MGCREEDIRAGEEGVTEACEERGGHRGVRRSRHLSCESTLAGDGQTWGRQAMYPAIHAFRPSVPAATIPPLLRPKHFKRQNTPLDLRLSDSFRSTRNTTPLAHSLRASRCQFSSIEHGSFTRCRSSCDLSFAVVQWHLNRADSWRIWTQAFSK